MVKRGLPFVHRFTASDVTTIALLGPDSEISKTAPALVQDGSSDRYTAVITPDECGRWLFTTEDGSGNITHECSFEVVEATEEEHALGVQNPYHAVIPFFPASVWSGGADSFTPGANDKTYVLTGKMRAPYDGYVYGIKIKSRDTLPDFDSIRFFSASGANTAFYVRGISEDFKDNAPDVAWTSDWETRTIMFAKPVWARQGDFFGLSIDDHTAGGATRALAWTQLISTAPPASAQPTDQNQTYYNNSALSLSASNSCSLVPASYGAKSIPFVQPLVHPPAIALGGHSFAAGALSHPLTYLFSSGNLSYDTDKDPAAMLSARLGVPVVNCAAGSTHLSNWVGSTGLMELSVKPLRPACLIFFSTSYSDTAEDSDLYEYITYWDRLHAHCGLYGIRLVVVESWRTTYDDKGAIMEEREAAIRAWCEHNQVLYVATNWRINRNSGVEHVAKRYAYYAGGDSGLVTYDRGDGVHPSKEALLAICDQIANALRYGSFGTPMFATRTARPEWMPQDAATMGTGINYRLTNSDTAQTNNLTYAPQP